MNLKSLEDEALALPAGDRAKLALELIESLDVFENPDLEDLWLKEAVRRAAQLDDGSVELIPGEVVAAQARALLG